MRVARLPLINVDTSLNLSPLINKDLSPLIDTDLSTLLVTDLPTIVSEGSSEHTIGEFTHRP